jgi:2-keto-4-pentenoate hydratase/2-oxohepta-3-ene-1,7-dioic acid hydratase in catechol pathway
MKIICIGMNYKDHALELGLDIPEKPVFFMKPETAMMTGNGSFPYPGFSKEVHYETEIVLKINKECKNVNREQARNCFNELTLGLDITARDLQRNAMKKGLPWEIAKTFDSSAPVGQFINVDKVKDLHNISFHLVINGSIRQKGNSSNLIFGFYDIIAYVSRFITLQPDDLIFTGTPVGVGEIKTGDKLEAYIGEKKLLECKII